MIRAPRVSVIMASYQHAAFVGSAIRSVLSQSFEDLECIVTDDGSTDGSADVIRSFTDTRMNVEVFGSNQGACEAANRCIARARGEYVALLNSDDAFLPDKLARQVAILDAAPELGAVFGLATFVDEEGMPIPPETNPSAKMFSAEPVDRFAWLRFFFFQGNALCHPTVMIRRRIYDELGNYDVALRQLPDMDMWVRVCAHYAIEVLPEPLTAFRILGGLRNTSAATPAVIRRDAWEQSRVLRRYRIMDEATLERAFGAEIPAHVSERGLPFAVQLALTAALHGPNAPRPVQVFALETLEDAVARGVPGLGPKDLHAVSGALNPFGLVLREEIQRTAADAPPSGFGTRTSNSTATATPHLTAIASDSISGRHRFTLPIRGLIERGMATGNVHLASDQNTEVTPYSPILLQRQLTLPPGALAAAKQSHCRLTHDLDDLLWAIPSESSGAVAFTPAVLAALDRQLAYADLITVATEPLAEAVRKRGYDSAILPNVVDPGDWTAQPLRSERTRPRIGWYGRRSAQPADLALVEHVIRGLIDEADFVFLGDTPSPLADIFARVERHRSVPPSLFPAMLAALDLDIVLEPLQSSAFNECKSNVRLLQAGMLGYPVIASDIEPHRSLPVIRLPNSASSWTTTIRDCMHEKAALRVEGETLRHAVHARFLVGDWAERFLALWTGRSPEPAHA